MKHRNSREGDRVTRMNVRKEYLRKIFESVKPMFETGTQRKELMMHLLMSAKAIETYLYDWESYGWIAKNNPDNSRIWSLHK